MELRVRSIGTGNIRFLLVTKLKIFSIRLREDINVELDKI